MIIENVCFLPARGMPYHVIFAFKCKSNELKTLQTIVAS